MNVCGILPAEIHVMWRRTAQKNKSLSIIFVAKITSHSGFLNQVAQDFQTLFHHLTFKRTMNLAKLKLMKYS